MSNDTISNLQQFFFLLWDMLCNIQVPGTDLYLVHLLVAPLGALAFITVFRKILDWGAGGSVSPRTRNRYKGDNK